MVVYMTFSSYRRWCFLSVLNKITARDRVQSNSFKKHVKEPIRAQGRSERFWLFVRAKKVIASKPKTGFEAIVGLFCIKLGI